MAYAPATDSIASYYLDANRKPTAFEEQVSLLDQQAMLQSTLAEFRSIPAPALMSSYSPPPHHFDALTSAPPSASMLHLRPVPLRASSWHDSHVSYTPVDVDDSRTSPPWGQVELPRSAPTDASYLASPDPSYRFPQPTLHVYENVAVDFAPQGVCGWESVNELGQVFDYDAQSTAQQQVGSAGPYSGDFVPRYSLSGMASTHSPNHSPEPMLSPESMHNAQSPELSQYLTTAPPSYSIQPLPTQSSPASAPAYPQALPLAARRSKSSSVGPADSKIKGKVETFSIWDGADPSEMPKRTYPSRGSSSDSGKVRSSTSVAGLGLALGPHAPTEEHDPERKFACDLCPKAFKRRGTYNQHRRTHTGERPHLCPLLGCRKAFQTTSNLKRHIGTHKKGDVRVLKLS